MLSLAKFWRPGLLNLTNPDHCRELDNVGREGTPGIPPECCILTLGHSTSAGTHGKLDAYKTKQKQTKASLELPILLPRPPNMLAS